MGRNLIGLSRRRIYQILELTDPEDKTSRLVSFTIVGLIIGADLAHILGRVHGVEPDDVRTATHIPIQGL